MGGRSTLSRLLDAASQIEDVVLSVRDAEPFVAFLGGGGEWTPASREAPDRAAGSFAFAATGGRRLLIVPDPVPGLGPLAGFVSGAAAARGRVAVVLAGDLPFVTAAFVDRIGEGLAADREHEAHVPLVDGRAQPLCAAYRSETVATAARLLARSGGTGGGKPPSMMSLLGSLRVRYLEPSDFGGVGSLKTITRGIDQPADLEWANRRAARSADRRCDAQSPGSQAS